MFLTFFNDGECNKNIYLVPQPNAKIVLTCNLVDNILNFKFAFV